MELPPTILELDPSLMKLDREQAFLLYATFCGDVERTAAGLNISPVALLRVVDEERWNDRLRSIIEMKNSEAPGDIERAINRALSFVQAHRMRLAIERVIRMIASVSDDALEDWLFPGNELTPEGHGTRQGPARKFSTRALADLASAMEKAHSMAYQALMDTTTERTKRANGNDRPGDISQAEMHARIAEAMATVGNSKTPRAMLLDAQIAEAEPVQPLRAASRKVMNPLLPAELEID